MTGQWGLTDHELVALRLLARGHTHTQIASLLKIRPETAGRLLHRVRTVLRANTLPHAVAIAYATGILGCDRTPTGAAAEGPNSADRAGRQSPKFG